MKKRNALAGALCVVFAVSLLLSGAFVSAHLEHDCAGEDCSVCAIIAERENSLRAGLVLIALVGIALSDLFARSTRRLAANGFLSPITLVCLKVKLTS